MVSETKTERGALALSASIALLALLYAASARLGLALDPVSGFATLVWPPTGIGLYFVLRFGTRLWPGVALGALAANAWAGAPLWVAAGIAVGNTLEAVVAARLLGRLGFRHDLRRVDDVLLLVVIAAGASTMLSASVGTAMLAAGGLTRPGALAATWFAWWLGDAMGDLLVAAPLFAWGARPLERPSRRRQLEGLGLALAVVALGVPILSDALPLATGARGTYLLFPILLWVGLRFDQRVTTAVTLAIATAAIVFAALGQGPFAHGTVYENLLALQSFLGVVTVTLLLFGAIMSERRQAVEIALSAARSRDEFLSIASHELRTPLSSMLLDLEGLKRFFAGAPGGDPSRNPVRVDRAVRQAQRLARLIDALLDVSRITSGRLNLRCESVDLALLATRVVEQFADAARAAEAPITLSAKGTSVGHWDSTRLEQVIGNLVSNALRHGRGQPIDVTVDAGASRVSLRVRDRGNGVPPEAIERIFDRFDRGSVPREKAGLGLGLFVARKIVEGHGGTIRAENPPGGGAQFVVELPSEAAAPTPP